MKWKVLSLGLVSASILAIAAFFLRPEPAASPVICEVHGILHANGTVKLGQTSFSDYDEMKVWLVAYKRKNPDCFLSLISDEGVQPELVERVFGVTRQAGFSSVGFITEPHALTH
jgi:biopolymer transport protein ExbD